MRRIILLLIVAVALLPNNSKAQRLSYDILKGAWQADKSSRDVKIFESDKLNFNGIDGHCFLRSTWAFNTDTSGVINVPASDWCKEPLTLPFKYALQEAAGYGGPVYKLKIEFENGFKDLIYIGWDKSGKLRIAYNEVIESSMSDYNKVTIGFTFKKTK